MTSGLVKAIMLVASGIVVYVIGVWLKGRAVYDDTRTAEDKAKVGKMSDKDLHDDILKRTK